jgi:Na+-transporting methylmalonyl-CoA/oxaloacetate decarboxylase beta subunit
MTHLDAELHRDYREKVPLAVFVVVMALIILALVGLAVALVAMRRANRPRPALPVNCGDCYFMIPRAKVYKRETLEDSDGLVHYLCEKRWIEVTPVSPWCELGKSRSRTTTVPT